MKTQGKFMLLTLDELAAWLNKKQVNRLIKLVQNHHTWEPSYNDFDGSNHFQMVQSMENYHIKNAGFKEIAQNFTTFPDGMIMVCRDLNTAPAGIKGANLNGICIEHVGNFDLGKDQMTDAHRKTIIGINALLCKRFGLPIDTRSIVYHHWYDLNTGKRTNGTGATKTCPGTNFFRGNTVADATAFFIPEIKKAVDEL